MSSQLYRYCTSLDSLYSEFEFLRVIFKVKHGYNAALGDKYCTLENSVATCRPPPVVPLARVVLPFFGATAYLLRTYLASLGISVAFKYGSTLRSVLYKPSTELSASDPHNVMYLLSCDHENCTGLVRGCQHRCLGLCVRGLLQYLSGSYVRVPCCSYCRPEVPILDSPFRLPSRWKKLKNIIVFYPRLL